MRVFRRVLAVFLVLVVAALVGGYFYARPLLRTGTGYAAHNACAVELVAGRDDPESDLPDNALVPFLTGYVNGAGRVEHLPGPLHAVDPAGVVHARLRVHRGHGAPRPRGRHEGRRRHQPAVQRARSGAGRRHRRRHRPRLRRRRVRQAGRRARDARRRGPARRAARRRALRRRLRRRDPAAGLVDGQERHEPAPRADGAPGPDRPRRHRAAAGVDRRSTRHQRRPAEPDDERPRPGTRPTPWARRSPGCSTTSATWRRSPPASRSRTSPARTSSTRAGRPTCSAGCSPSWPTRPTRTSRASSCSPRSG